MEKVDVPSEMVVAVEQLRADLGDDIMLELVGLFLTNAPELLASMRAGIASLDARAVGRAAHELKSTAASLGCTALARQCADIEASAPTAPVSSLAAPVANAESLFAEARAAIQQLVAAHGRAFRRPSSVVARRRIARPFEALQSTRTRTT